MESLAILEKAKYGILGGLIGACIGGMVFDPISMATKGEV